MEISTFIILGAIVVILGYVVVLNGKMSKQQQNISQAWAHVDAMLKQRHAELPKLVESCKHYMLYEQETLEQVMQARAAVSTASEQYDIAALGIAEGQLRLGLNNLYEVAAGYPELMANETFRQLQSDISELEGSIALRREFYNEGVKLNNARIERCPNKIIARLFGFQPAKPLEFNTGEGQETD